MTAKKQKIKENLAELEKIVKNFEEGKIDIDKGIGEYKKAAKLIKEIRDELEAKRLKVEEIGQSL